MTEPTGSPQEIRAQKLRAYTFNERLTAKNIHDCAAYADTDVDFNAILKDLDHMVASHNNDDPVQQRLVSQLQVLDAAFHHLVNKGCSSDANHFKTAFMAQKLFADTSKLISENKLPLPKF